jgi:hypothetical protein
MNDDGDWIYEEPGSLFLEDWERFRLRMQAEVAAHPDREAARDAFKSAEKTIAWLKQSYFYRDGRTG